MVLGVMNSHKAKAYELYTEQHRREGKPVKLGLLLRLQNGASDPVGDDARGNTDAGRAKSSATRWSR